MKLLNFIYATITLFAFVGFIAPEKHVFQNREEFSNTIKIGLLIQDHKFVEAKQAAQMAIDKANIMQGKTGTKFQLVTRSMEGSWGTGSKQAVDLIFKENVWAILGSHDGRNAHLVEQASAKTRTVFLSAWTSDPTLSKAFVPWYFSCIPNDNQQAKALLEAMHHKRKINKIAALADNGYDSKLALSSFLKEAKLDGNPDIIQFLYDDATQNFDKILDQIAKADADGIILFGQPEASIKIMQQMRQKKINLPIYGTLSFLGVNGFAAEKIQNYKGVTLVNSGNWPETKTSLSFKNEFHKKYGKMPSAVSAYAFDGINVIIEAIKNAGFDREKLQKSMSSMNYQGITGPIQFDDKGNRTGKVSLIEIKNGIPVAINK